MNKYLPLLILIAIFLSMYYAGQFFSNTEDGISQEIHLDAGDCSPVLSACTVIFEQAEIIIRFPQRPSALKVFDVEVSIRNLEVEKVNITFLMDKMDMGFNSFVLNQQSQQHWVGKVILPVCSSGRNDWTAQLRIKNKNKILRSDFKFEVY